MPIKNQPIVESSIQDPLLEGLDINSSIQDPLLEGLDQLQPFPRIGGPVAEDLNILKGSAGVPDTVAKAMISIFDSSPEAQVEYLKRKTDEQGNPLYEAQIVEGRAIFKRKDDPGTSWEPVRPDEFSRWDVISTVGEGLIMAGQGLGMMLGGGAGASLGAPLGPAGIAAGGYVGAVSGGIAGGTAAEKARLALARSLGFEESDLEES